MKIALLLTLALSVFGVQAQTAQVILLNATQGPVQVLADDRKVAADIAPGGVASVTFIKLQWMQRGMKAYRYNTTTIQRLKRKGQDVVLQLGPNASLYLMPRENSVAGDKPPAQPKGFPIRPDRTYTLR